MTRPTALLLALAACSGPDTGDSGDSGEPAFARSAGEDLDQEEEVELASGYALPEAFYDALDTLGLEPADLEFPDAGATWYSVPTRFEWTDTLRHDGQQAPVFGHLVGERVEAALEAEPHLRGWELLAAMDTFADRLGLVATRYDRAYQAGGEEPLLESLRRAYEHDPVEGHPSPPTRSWSEVEGDVREQLAAFPLETRAAVALALDALVDAAELRDEALLAEGELTMDQWAELHADYWDGRTNYSVYSHAYGTDAAPGFDLHRMVRAGQLAVRAVEDLRLALADAPLSEGQVLQLATPLGLVRVDMEDAGGEVRREDWLLLVDGGGDDVYYDHIAANEAIWLPVTAVLDLRGDDTYRPSIDWSIEEGSVRKQAARAQGVGVLGVGILDDAGGDDTYHASAVCQGAAVFGVGALLDHGGRDAYSGYVSCQGSADWGLGLLADLGDGADTYETLQKSQGYGGPVGVGLLVDEAGGDTYTAISDPIIWDWAGEGTNWSGSQGFGYGVRDGFFDPDLPVFSGGLGALVDLDGDDRYACAVMCQGFGYAFGTGLLYDRAGDDEHLTTHKYSLGSATHWAVGLYVDLEGSDTYRNSGDDECIGEGYDASVAFHLDRGDGDDTYTLDNAGDFTLGVGRIPALGVFLNEGGSDTYQVPGAGQRSVGRSYTASGNRGGYLARVPNVGMFFDLGGDDTYDIARDEVANGAEWVQADAQGGDWDPAYDFGYGLDAE